MVFARPALHSGEASGSAASVEMVIILDNGIHSSTESRDGQLLKLSVEVCRQLVELAGRGDRITLIPSALPRRTFTVPAGQRELIVDRLAGIEPQFTAPDYDRSIAIADSIFSTSDLFNRELYLISGFYGSNWDSLDINPSTDKVRRFIFPVGQKVLDNLSVSQIRLKNSIIQRGDPVEFEVVFNNYSKRSVDDVLVSLYLDDERVAQASLSIPTDGVVTKIFSVVPEHSGLIAGKVKIEDIDPLPVDSRRFFTLNIPDSSRVLCVAPATVDSIVLSAALSGGNTDFIRLYWGDRTGWETGSLAGYDVLLLAGVNSVSAGAAERVGEFVKQGGGVVIFQGKDSDLAELSRSLWQRLGFAGARGTIQDGSIGWGKFDLQHPLFRGMFDKTGSPRSPSITFAVDLAIGKNDQVIIPLSNGRPFLLERQVGRGRALMFSIPISAEGGSFIYSGMAAPLIFRAVGYVNSVSEEGISDWTTGSNERILLSSPQAVTARLEFPDGDFTDLPPRSVVGGVEYQVSRINLPGVYNLKLNKQITARYAANIPLGWSDLQKIDLDKFSKRFNCIILKSDTGDLNEAVYTARFGRELWHPIAVIFLLLLVAESLIGRAWRKKR